MAAQISASAIPTRNSPIKTFRSHRAHTRTRRMTARAKKNAQPHPKTTYSLQSLFRPVATLSLLSAKVHIDQATSAPAGLCGKSFLITRTKRIRDARYWDSAVSTKAGYRVRKNSTLPRFQGPFQIRLYSSPIVRNQSKTYSISAFIEGELVAPLPRWISQLLDFKAISLWIWPNDDIPWTYYQVGSNTDSQKTKTQTVTIWTLLILCIVSGESWVIGTKGEDAWIPVAYHDDQTS